jgi:hypothetical protein
MLPSVGTRLAHNLLQFPIENVYYSLHARLTESRKPPNLRPAEADTGCAKCQRLEHVSTPADATVEQHWNALTDRGHDLR